MGTVPNDQLPLVCQSIDTAPVQELPAGNDHLINPVVAPLGGVSFSEAAPAKVPPAIIKLIVPEPESISTL